MTESSNIARPYAQAIFELARDTDRLDEWSQSLQMLCEIVEHPDVGILINDPRVTRQQVLEVLMEIGRDGFDEQTRNLVRILGHYRRLAAVPSITAQYESLRAVEEGVIEAELETAFEIDDEHRAGLISALQNRLGSKVRLTSSVNPDLLGGVVVRAGDWVIDGSVRARLEKLSSSLGV
ncbi:MAG: F0F1 ATP synthase subunit delta [Acidiferrobacterales bacterium]|nr:F0F1 ATP synthase subunit delta [Acidiferrobacterales bacterium]